VKVNAELKLATLMTWLAVELQPVTGFELVKVTV
jgi:hypothetical protein